MEQATLGGGCFWCLEAAFEPMDGVESVVSGYAGGHDGNPSHRAVHPGRTQGRFRTNPDHGHCRVVVEPRVARARARFMERIGT